MTKSLLKTILSVLLSGLVLLAEGLTCFAVWKLDMLPDNLFVILVGVLVLLWVLITLLLVLPRRKPDGKPIRQIIASILAVILVAGCGAVSSVVQDVYQMMDNITKPVTGTAMTVYVLADDPADTLSDARDYCFAIMSLTDAERSEKAAALIEQELGAKLWLSGFSSAPEMVSALYSGQVGAVILNDAYLPLLEEFEPYADFADRVKAIFTFTVAEETKKPTEPNQEDTRPPQQDATEATSNESVIAPFLMYISGSDTRNHLLTTSRSDVNILAAVNPETKQILLVNTPRDYYVANPAGSGAMDKLTHCGIYGIQCSVQALSNLYNAPVDHYVQFNFSGFETLIDAIGGITVYSDMAFAIQGGSYYIVQGANELNGSQALSFARERYGVSGGDNTRGQNQMKVINAVISKLSSSTIIKNYAQILDSLEGMFATDFTTTEISNLVKMQLSDMASWEVFSYAVTGKGARAETFSMPGYSLYVMKPNEETVAHAQDLIGRILGGDKLTQADMALPS